MDFLSIGIGLLSVSSGIIIKGVSYIRGCDRAMSSIERQLRDYTDLSSRERADIRQDLAVMQSELSKLQRDMNALTAYGDGDGSDH